METTTKKTDGMLGPAQAARLSDLVQVAPGAITPSFNGRSEDAGMPSQLTQWPIQLHLLQPVTPFLRDSDLLVAADCVAYSIGGFHARFLRDHSLAIACPKLDSHQEVYLDKLIGMIDQGGIRSLTVMVMEVPCCGGLVGLVEEALRRARGNVPVQCLVVGTQGAVLGEYSLAS
jgi:hypothetical protein